MHPFVRCKRDDFGGSRLFSSFFRTTYKANESAVAKNRFLIAAGILIVAIVAVDWQSKPFISIGFSVFVSDSIGILSAAKLRPVVDQHVAIDLSSVLDELRVLLEPS